MESWINNHSNPKRTFHWSVTHWCMERRRQKAVRMGRQDILPQPQGSQRRIRHLTYWVGCGNKGQRSFDRMNLPETPLGPALRWWCNSEGDNPAMEFLWNRARERQTCPIQVHLQVSRLSGLLSPMLFCFICVLLWWESSLSLQEIFGDEQTGGL